MQRSITRRPSARAPPTRRRNSGFISGAPPVRSRTSISGLAAEQLEQPVGDRRGERLGALRPGLDMTMMAGQVAQPPDVDLQRRHPGTGERTQAVPTQGVVEGGVPEPRRQHRQSRCSGRGHGESSPLVCQKVLRCRRGASRPDGPKEKLPRGTTVAAGRYGRNDSRVVVVVPSYREPGPEGRLLAQVEDSESARAAARISARIASRSVPSRSGFTQTSRMTSRPRTVP